ncbi:MAG TPA: nuclease-related domain-containing protein [Chloroflexota bacterium]|nr:nuclease-related domain-containing protein [Chloroflexota bacterium]
MRTVVNERYVGSRMKIGNYSHFASMALLVIGFVLSLMTGTFGQEVIFVSYVCLIGAFLLLSYGRRFTRRWGPRFRQDQWLVPALKGVDANYTMFNYAAPGLPDHLIVGPSGLYVLVPRPNGGTVQFQDGRWSRGSAGSTIFRGLAEGGLGNPMRDAQIALQELADYLRKNGSEELISGLEARPVIVFTNPGVDLVVKNPPLPIVKTRDLKSLFRRAKSSLEPNKIEELKQVLGQGVSAQ